MKLADVLLQNLVGPVILLLDDVHGQGVNLALGFAGTVGGIAATQVLILLLVKSDHAKLLRHAKTRDHGPGQLGSLLNIIGCPGGDGGENQLLRRAAAGEGRNFVLNVLLAHEVAVLFLHLHGEAQRA